MIKKETQPRKTTSTKVNREAGKPSSLREPKASKDSRNSRNSRFSRESRISKDSTASDTPRNARPSRATRPVNRKPAAPQKPKTPHPEGAMRLNKYIAHAGICSRREADELIAAGSVKVNGKVVTEMGYQVMPGDEVNYGGEKLRSERHRYFLLNKPKGYITTSDDPQERKTVMMLMDGCCSERIYPVGRLDRATTGLLLFTNDGELTRKLTHPSSQIYKVYQVELNKPVAKEDMKKLLDGIELEDGPMHVDEIQYAANGKTIDKRIVGVELHSGRNRIVRRLFEALGYEVHKLDRVVFAGLTKKDLPRGRWRELTEKEVGFLKMI
ncbi:MAG: RNA-binding S4 domain-containing protein [Bacteroidales bacterium]|nr:RNA-binding S4 domain-containing protein [Bacteroidales bacterium]